MLSTVILPMISRLFLDIIVSLHCFVLEKYFVVILTVINFVAEMLTSRLISVFIFILIPILSVMHVAMDDLPFVTGFCRFVCWSEFQNDELGKVYIFFY